MLELLGLGIDLVPLVAQRLGQVQLDQPVVADDFESDLLPSRGE